MDIFTLIYPFSPLSPSLWETARYRLKYCLKGPLNPKQPTKVKPKATNQPTGLHNNRTIAYFASSECRLRDFDIFISFFSLLSGRRLDIGRNTASKSCLIQTNQTTSPPNIFKTDVFIMQTHGLIWVFAFRLYDIHILDGCGWVVGWCDGAG